MLVWRRSLSWSHRYKMFSVVVSWTNNKDPTSDKGIWLFGTEWEAQCSTRGCPSLAEPFSTLGTDIKAASTPLKCSHIHRHKDRHTRTHTCMPADTCTQHLTHAQCRKYACHGHAGKGGSKNNFLSTGIRKTTVERGSAWERVRDKGIRSVRTHQSAEGKYVRETQPYEHCHCPPEQEDRGDRVVESELRARETIFHINRDIGRLVRFKCAWDKGTHNSLRTR